MDADAHSPTLSRASSRKKGEKKTSSTHPKLSNRYFN
jgi:hypothetical protein